MITIALNLFLIVLLLAALGFGVRLDRRLKAIQSGQLAFAQAARDLDAAAGRAREGLAELHSATHEATDVLGGRIARAREVADRLDKLVSRAESQPRPAEGPQGGLAALLAEIKKEEPTSSGAITQRPLERPSKPFRARIDEDLFEDLGERK